ASTITVGNVSANGSNATCDGCRAGDGGFILFFGSNTTVGNINDSGGNSAAGAGGFGATYHTVSFSGFDFENSGPLVIGNITANGGNGGTDAAGNGYAGGDCAVGNYINVSNVTLGNVSMHGGNGGASTNGTAAGHGGAGGQLYIDNAPASFTAGT